MLKLNILFIVWAVVGLAIVLAENNIPTHSLVQHIRKGVAGPNPYIFLTAPSGHSQSVIRGFEVTEENDEKSPLNADINEEDEMEEDDNENLNENNEEEESIPVYNNNIDDEKEAQDKYRDDKAETNTNYSNNDVNIDLEFTKYDNPIISNAKEAKVKSSQPHRGTILVPHDIIEIEGHTVIDHKTGKSVLLLPRSVLNAIPDGSVVAVMERSQSDESEGRANRVIVKGRRKGPRRNLKRFRGGNRRYRVVKRNGNKRRNNSKHQNVIIVRRRNRRNGNRRGVNRRRIYI